MERLDSVAARQTVRLTHGRKSGKPYEVTIWFVVDGDRVYLGTANVHRQWVRNVQKTPTVRLRIGGETFEGEAVAFCQERGILVVPGQCPFMFLPDAGTGHRLHGFIRKIPGCYPRLARASSGYENVRS